MLEAAGYSDANTLMQLAFDVEYRLNHLANRFPATYDIMRRIASFDNSEESES